VSAQPKFIPQDTAQAWAWRIRNLPYEKSVYKLSVDEEKQQIVLRTTNKKYFKRFDIPTLKRNGEKLNPRAISCKYDNNTLLIQYMKPKSVLVAEREWREKQFKAATSKSEGGSDGPGDCKQQ